MQGPPPGFTPGAQRAALDLPTAQAQGTAAAVPPAQQKRVRRTCLDHTNGVQACV